MQPKDYNTRWQSDENKGWRKRDDGRLEKSAQQQKWKGKETQYDDDVKQPLRAVLFSLSLFSFVVNYFEDSCASRFVVEE
jgi:hypothetical protein